MRKFFGGVEAGGTKFVCAIGSGPEDIVAETRFATTSPIETLNRAVKFFDKYRNDFPLEAIGIASFGPIDLDPDSSSYGSITKTPKPGWSNSQIVDLFIQKFEVPVGFDTDVNGALLGEYSWGAAKGMENSLYLTVGTGIGGGVMVNRKLVHGLLHPEIGHMYLPHDIEKDPFSGRCPFHADCFEGLASGPAIEARWGQKAETLSADHPAWILEAQYIAQALHSLICVLSPQRIVLGGGIMNQIQIFPLVRQNLLDSLNGYVNHDSLLNHVDNYIVPPLLGNRAGVLGAIALAQDAIA
jgi:fructokinase